MEAVERKGCIRYGKQIYQILIKCGMEKISYSSFCGFIRDGGKLLPVRMIDEDFVFADDDDFFLLTEKMAALLSAEANSVCHGITNQEEK